MTFRDLPPGEEQAFRQWANANYKQGDAINPLWHPVVREECEPINYDRFRVALDLQDASNMRAIAREFVRIVDAAMRDTGSTIATWSDPAVILTINKLESLARSEANYSVAYQACRATARP
jgi:hypothetical protein